MKSSLLCEMVQSLDPQGDAEVRYHLAQAGDRDYFVEAAAVDVACVGGQPPAVLLSADAEQLVMRLEAKRTYYEEHGIALATHGDVRQPVDAVPPTDTGHVSTSVSSTVEPECITLLFSQSVTMVGYTVDEARALAKYLLAHADDLTNARRRSGS